MSIRGDLGGLVACVALMCACSSNEDSGTSKTKPIADEEFGPPAGFMDEHGQHALIAEVKGRLNSYETAASTDDAVSAKAHLTAILGGVSTELPESPLVYSYRYPDSASVPDDLQGRELIAFHAMTTDPSSTHAHFAHLLGQITVFRDDLDAARAAGTPWVDGARASVHRIDSIYRADKVSLVKSCLVAVGDAEASSQSVFVDGRENPSFGDGETLTAWANIPLTTDPATLAKSPTNHAHQGGFCHCKIADQPVACAAWEKEAENDGSKLSCEVPPGLLEEPAPSHVALTFKGAIGSATDEYSTLAIASYDVVVDGKTRSIDYKSYAVRHPIEAGVFAGKDLVTLYGLGELEELGTDRYRYALLQTHVMVDALTAVKASGAQQMSLDAEHVYSVSLLDAEINGDYGRFCPRAVLDESAQPSVIFTCNAKNQSFAVGEPLELAANLPLTSEASAIAEQFGTAECGCVKGETDIPCSSFPE